MKAIRKVLVTGACAALLVGASVLTTMAYLTDTEDVINTFTVGKVYIDLDEAKVNNGGLPLITKTGDNVVSTETDGYYTSDGYYTDKGLQSAYRVKKNDYHLLPGHVYYKDPTVHITQGSEDCYVWMSMEVTNSKEWDNVCDKYEVDAQGNVTKKSASSRTVTEGSHALGITDILKKYKGDTWKCLTNVEDTTANTRTYWFEYQYTPEGATSATNILTKDKFASANYTLTPLFQRIEIPGEFTNEDMAILNGGGATIDGGVSQTSGVSPLAGDTGTSEEGESNNTDGGTDGPNSGQSGEQVPSTDNTSAFQIIVKAYAIQADGMEDAADAWNKLNINGAPKASELYPDNTGE